MNHSETWYIVKRENGHCEISTDNLPEDIQKADPPIVQHWGPFDSLDAAIARRVGLIRAGKCQPVQVQSMP